MFVLWVGGSAGGLWCARALGVDSFGGGVCSEPVGGRVVASVRFYSSAPPSIGFGLDGDGQRCRRQGAACVGNLDHGGEVSGHR